MGITKRTFQSAGQISQHLIPGAYSRIDSVKGTSGLVSANNGVIMGQSTGGQPATLLQFNTVAEAINTLRTGPLMDAVRLAFNPGNDLVPQRLFAMRVNTALQSSLDLEDGSANGMVLLTSLGYGLWANQIRVVVATGTNFGKKITLKFQTNPDEVFDDVRRQSFTIEYTDAACTMTIVNHSGTKTLVTSVGGISITLTDYPTIGELAAYINAQADFTCSAIAGQETASSSELDGVDAQDINTSEYTAESTMQAIIDEVTAGSGLVVATASNGAVTRTIPANLVETYFASGSEGTYSTSEWTAALLALEAENVQLVATPDNVAAQHAQIKAHCVAMSAVTGKKERQFLVGSPWKAAVIATEITAAKSAAVALNSKYGLYCFNGGTQYDKDDVIQNYSAGYAACMLLGMKVALAINQPMTFKTLNFIELEWKLSESQMEDLIENGVAPNNYNSSGIPHHVRQINTYQTGDLKWNEFSMVTEMLFASRDLRTYLEELFTGQPSTNIMSGVLKGAVEARLERYKELAIFITNPQEGRAWWNVVVSISGDTVMIDYDAYVTAPINFQFITNHFHELVATV